MIKVCHMTSVHPPEDIRIFHKECVSLAKAGYDVYLVERGDSYEKNGVHIVGIGEVAQGRLKRITEVARQTYEAALATDSDIYHLHDPELLPYGLKLKKRGKKVIFDSHEYYRMQMQNKPYLPRWASYCVSKCYTVLEDYTLHRIDGAVFPCEINGKNPFAGKCAHTALLNNVPLLDELYNHYDESIPKRDRSVVHVGNLAYFRGITHMVKAAAKADCTAYLAGHFSPPAYRAEVESLPEYACVRYQGHLSRSEILNLLQSCRIGIATLLNIGQYSQSENLATKVYEYMSLGLPVVLSKTPYNEKMVERYHFGICVDPEDIAAQAEAIQYLLDHPDEAQRMGENGRRAVKENFNWGVEEKKLLALYEDILKEYQK